MENQSSIRKHMEEIVGGLSKGSKITVTGQVPSNPFRMQFDLCNDIEGREISVHFNPRFDQNCVVRNTKLSHGWDDWDREERYGGFPFKPNATFKLEIICEENHFCFYVDGRFFADYRYKLPLPQVKYFRICDDVDVVQVQIKT